MNFKKVYLEITNICNLNCPFCIGNSRQKKELSMDEFKTILTKLTGYTKYLYFHILGEPLIHSKINEFIDYAAENGFFINITTNGYLIEKIKNNKNIRQLNISLHSYNEKGPLQIDEYLTKVFATVDELIKNKTYVSLRVWVNNKNSDKIADFINQRYKTNVNLSEYAKINKYLFINPFHEFIWPDLNNGYYNEKGTCYALKDHIGILVDGTIIPCCLDSKGIINLGNIYENDLSSILKEKRVKNMLKGFQNHQKCEELCKHCSFIERKEENE